MITADKSITMRFKVFAKSKDMLEDISGKIREDFVSVLHHYEKENNDDLQIHILAEDRCAHCGRLPWDCQCGRPKQRPLV